jgi:ABC-2 type transport system ATP-binding protein
MPDNKNKVEVCDLKKHFGPIEAVRGISFEVSKGEVLGFLGPNGAGKSTTMRMITGFLPPSAGTALVGGYDVTTDPIKVKQQIGYLPENAPAYESMSVTNFLRFAGSIRNYRGSELADRVNEAINKCSLQGVRNQTISTLSKGYRQRSCFAQAILHDPPVLIMDEPTDGLDPNQKHVVREMIQKMASEKAIIISTHILEEVDAVCTKAIIIAHGKVVANGTPDELRAKSSTGRLDDVFRMLTIEKEA